MKLPAPLWLGLGLGAVALVGVAWFGRRALDTVIAVAPKLTPASPENVIYADVIGGTGRVLSQDPSWTLGGWVADLRDRLSGDDARIRKMLEGAPAASHNYPDL